jgi:hypothetical protein
MTKRQTSFYWRTWAAICAAQGWSHEPAAKKDVRRKATHLLCGLKERDGSPRSMTTFSNRDFSRWLKAVAHLQDKVDVRDRDRENALHTLRKDAAKAHFDEAYIQRICSDLHGTSDYERLPQEKLESLRNLIHNRAGSGTRASRPRTDDQGHDADNTPAEAVPAHRSGFSYCMHPVPSAPEASFAPAEISGTNPF